MKLNPILHKLGPFARKAKKLTTLKFIDFLVKSGFKNLRRKKYVFLHKRKKIVCKIGGLVCGPKPIKACPTITIKKTDIPKRALRNYSFGHGYSDLIRIQPLLDTSKATIREIWPDINQDSDLYGEDAHEGNIGLYKGKIKVFDW